MNNSEIIALKNQLSQLSSEYLPEPIFNELGRLVVFTAIEFIPLRRTQNSIEVLLFRRSSSDPNWPNMLHTPGTILRPTDTSFEDASTRLFNEELKSIPLTPTFIGNELIKNNRGRVVLFKYIVDMTGVDSAGEYFDIKNLPDDLLPEQRNMALEAARHFN